MNTAIFKQMGLSDNEIKIYLHLLRSGSSTAYEISKKTGIYRVHVYDKIEQLMDKGLVSHVYKGAKKFFQAAHPSKLRQYVQDKKKELENQESEIDIIMPELEGLTQLPREDTFVEVFKGIEGLKYFFKDIIKEKKEVLISGIDDEKYQQSIPEFMQQYFRDLKREKIHERVITIHKKEVFLFTKKQAPTSVYRFLKSTEFNPTNTYIYADKIVLVTWGNPVTAVMIKNKQMAQTYRDHFEQLWKIADTKVLK